MMELIAVVIANTYNISMCQALHKFSQQTLWLSYGKYEKTEAQRD